LLKNTKLTKYFNSDSNSEEKLLSVERPSTIFHYNWYVSHWCRCSIARLMISRLRSLGQRRAIEPLLSTLLISLINASALINDHCFYGNSLQTFRSYNVLSFWIRTQKQSTCVVFGEIPCINRATSIRLLYRVDIRFNISGSFLALVRSISARAVGMMESGGRSFGRSPRNPSVMASIRCVIARRTSRVDL